MQTALTILLSATVLVALAVVLAYILGWASRTFHVEQDPKVQALMDVLPGANCGACGYIGCEDYAEAVARGEAEVTLCAPGGAGCSKKIAEIMGVEVEETWPYRAVVHCAAESHQRKLKHPYFGEPTCAAANLVSGVQGCIYGCLGFGDCERACDYDAIHVVNGLARVDYDKCVGCKVCARVCPRNIISMVPFKDEQVLVVACSNQDFGPDVKRVCEVGCIGCKACTRMAEAIAMEGNLPKISYEDYNPAEDFLPVVEKCPMEALFYIGKPSEADKAKVADEQMPKRATADFETSVDKTDWWG